MAEGLLETSRGEPGVIRGVLAIVLTGVALGVAYNALGQAGPTKRGLSWIAEERHLDSLESAQGGPPTEASGTAATGLPDVPDVGRPLQMDLPVVRKFFEARGALFVDAREPAEYAAGHIPGAINLPYEQSVTDPAKLESLDSGAKPVIIYCGGGTCEVSMNLAFALVEAGHKKVLVFTGGFPEWEAAGLPTERS